VYKKTLDADRLLKSTECHTPEAMLRAIILQIKVIRNPTISSNYTFESPLLLLTEQASWVDIMKLKV